ncbi:MBL fold metallo-hydrolase [Alisedimentitalea sp. MJ-SS2]|uniref:MBL fold metallo-hydrolase n=1 Tax=Aliisedimentitalea sp. MJ-SS2 TaxID=3049795 RepID=UPI002910F1E7|nr:MBL fold metallo-hydrolase [Alisedimentitalea sp. MJ-SS2]MDU8926107.1 MBL fold metallo-hydrolase [Alisedimentitalea sp. MJ-SS2]
MLRFLLPLLLLLAPPAHAQTGPSQCIAIADAAPGLQYLHKASFRDPLPDHTVRISYIAHASFLIQTPDGVSAVTDYTGFIGTTGLVPDIVTMNHAHDTHWTPVPDPAIRFVLQGWGETPGTAARHRLQLNDLLLRNIPTDIRSFDGIEPAGNSIFVFEVAGLCIGHLGHLHHEPTEAQYAALGRLDVVMAAVDGGMTLDLPTMIKVLKRLKSSTVIPMHWFEGWTLDAFLTGMADEFAIIDNGATSLTVSLRTLPRHPTVHVLRPRFLRDPE